MPSPAVSIGLGLAGLAAGFANGAAGGGSLAAFPALLAAGYSPLVAKVSTTVGIFPAYVGGVVGFSGELRAQRERLWSLLPASLCGSALGVVLLLSLPAGAFTQVVPYLVIASCLIFAFQPLIARWPRAVPGSSDLPVPSGLPEPAEAAGSRPGGVRRGRPRWSLLLHGGVFVGSIYGAYFGAALGLVLLAVLGLALSDSLVRLNGLRSAISLVVNLLAGAVFVIAAPVAWVPVALMAGTSAAGGYFGARVARRVNADLLRGVVVVVGLVTAGFLLAR